MSKIAELKSQIASAEEQGMASADPVALLAMYRELVPMLVEPKVRYKDMTPQERLDFRTARRERRRAARAQGLNPRTMKPWTPEQLAKQEERKAKAAERWTPEKKAELSAKLKGRTISDEQRARLKEAAAARRERQAAMESRLAELEAMLAAKTAGNGNEESVPESESSDKPQRRGRNR